MHTRHIACAAAIAAALTAVPAEAKYKYAKATCYDLTGKTASGKFTAPGTAAHNFLPFGTKIRLVGKQAGPAGRRRYVIRDTGSALYDGHFDLWAPKGYCTAFGVRTIKYRFGW